MNSVQASVHPYYPLFIYTQDYAGVTMRNYALDNIKIFMIFFVVFGHLIEPLIAQIPAAKIIWVWIYSFHMPVFVMVAGMLSKAVYGPAFFIKLVKTILVPLFVFTIGYEIFHFFLIGALSNYALHFQPYWLLWFLLSLFIWRAGLPIFLKLPFPTLLAILVAIAAGYIDPIGRDFGISRTLYFFPFFIFGHTLLPRFLAYVHTHARAKYLFGGGLILSLCIAVSLQGISDKWMLGSHSYKSMGYDFWIAGLYRFVLYAFSFCISLVIIGLIPNKKISLSAKGNASLYIYIWHGFFIKALIAIGFIEILEHAPLYISFSVFLLLSLILVFGLSSNVVKRFTEKYLLNPIKTRLP